MKDPNAQTQNQGYPLPRSLSRRDPTLIEALD